MLTQISSPMGWTTLYLMLVVGPQGEPEAIVQVGGHLLERLLICHFPQVSTRLLLAEESERVVRQLKLLADECLELLVGDGVAHSQGPRHVVVDLHRHLGALKNKVDSFTITMWGKH